MEYYSSKGEVDVKRHEREEFLQGMKFSFFIFCIFGTMCTLLTVR